MKIPTIFFSTLVFLSCTRVTSSFLPRSFSENNIKVEETASMIAHSLNDEGFLQTLVSMKAAKDMEYRTVHNNDLEVNDAPCKTQPSLSECFSTVCEYTAGKLWFLPKGGLKFREKMTIKEVSVENHRAIVECEADYFDGKKWVKCAKTTCEINSRSLDRPKYLDVNFDSNRQAFGARIDNQSFELSLDVKTNLMIRLPLVAGKVSNLINSTFKDAVVTFVQSHHGLPLNALTVA